MFRPNWTLLPKAAAAANCCPCLQLGRYWTFVPAEQLLYIYTSRAATGHCYIWHQLLDIYTSRAATGHCYRWHQLLYIYTSRAATEHWVSEAWTGCRLSLICCTFCASTPQSCTHNCSYSPSHCLPKYCNFIFCCHVHMHNVIFVMVSL